MSNQHPTIAASRLEKYEQPVLYTPNGPTIWHVPVLETGMVRSACGYLQRRRVRTTSLELFRRRRGANMCDHCKSKLETNQYPENAPIREGEA